MIGDEPQIKCPYCRGIMPGWLSAGPAKSCEICERPLLRLPSLSSALHLAIISVIDLVKVAMLPFVGATLVLYGMDRITTDDFAACVAAALLLWGVFDVWDGTAGLNTGIERIKRQTRRGAQARRMSIAKTFFGISSTLLGALGLLLVS